MKIRLAIIATHPIQYYSPWYRTLAANPSIQLRVFYLWDFGVTEKIDKGFGTGFSWDIPLMDGYESSFVPNESDDPGTHHFKGLVNSRLYKEVAEWSPDAVFLTAYRYRATLGFLAQWKLSGRRAPVFFRGDSHRLIPETGWKNEVKRLGVSMIFRQFDGIFSVGKANREYFKLHGVSDRKLFFTPHCIDNQRFMEQADQASADAVLWRKELKIPKSHVVLLFAGKLQDKKRPQDLLEAFLALNPPKTTLLFVGNGDLEEQLKERAAGHRSIRFAPFQNQSQMPRTYAACDLFVLPSYSATETWGLAVNEAMCLGKPALVSDLVGCHFDMVKPGETGLVFKAGDVEDLKEKLADALSDRKRLRQWGENARRWVGRYSYKNATRGLLKALKKLAQPPMAFFDGECVMCQRQVKRMMKFSDVIRVAPKEGETFQAVYTEEERAAFPSSVIARTRRGRSLAKTDAVAYLLRQFRKPLCLAGYVLDLVPRSLSDRGYDWVALNRKRLFGTRACPVPPKEWRNRFLP